MNRTWMVGLAAAILLAFGLWAAFSPMMPKRAPGSGRPPTPGELANPGDDVVARAMEAAPATVDSTEIKRRWQNEVRGVDLEGLDPSQLELFVRFANARGCTCGCGYTLAGCKASDMSCEVSGAKLEALKDSIRAGHIRSARGIRARPATRG